MLFYGASGHAKVVIEAWLESGGEVTEIFDDNLNILSLLDFPVAGKFSKENHTVTPLVISIGSNAIRKEISMKLEVNFGKVVHPSAVISSSCQIEEGTVVMAGVIINSSCAIGRHVILNTGTCVDHDCLLEDFVHLAPNSTLCGDVKVGEGALIGAGATILPQKKVGRWSVVGAGSTVIDDVPDFSVVVGSPARIIRSLRNI